MSEKIKQYLNTCARMYYSGTPLIPDDVYDRLAESIKYDEVGYSSEENEGKHLFPMYSLQKYYEGEGTKPVLNGQVDQSPKLDGAAVSLLYINGRFVRALTRGDGILGKDITEKFEQTKHIPHSIEFNNSPDVVQITGEVVAPSHVENARNYAAGSLNLKDVDEFKTRAVDFFAYSVQPSLTGFFNSDMKLLANQGFNTVKDPNIDKIYPCDGVVYRLNSVKDFEAAGYTAKHPRGAYALKQRSSATETVLLDVVWQTGKSGKVTPVAILEPIKIGDAIISKATLNNIGFIRALDLRIGDIVGVIRSGEIIPKIVYKADA